MVELVSKIQKVSMFLTEYFADAATYFRYCGISPFQDKTRKLFYKILIEAHALEKGLSLANPRSLFGAAKIRFLMKAVDRYDLTFSRLPGEKVCGIFHAYIDLHSKRAVNDPLLVEMAAFLDRYEKVNSISPDGGLRRLDDETYDEFPPAARLLVSRHSNRMFADETLARSDVENIVRIAQSAPSQCNRQSCKAYFFQNRDDIDRLLKLQAGSTGFSADVNNLFVITSDLAAWGGAQQRNQAYVDGALFAMNVMLACHALEIASCPLNLAVTHKVENAIKQVGSINEGERLIMMIAVGRPVSRGALKVARSPRRPLAEILVTRMANERHAL
ncbi:nitroreductase [Neorhizobium galegae]|uniref:nitroreductase family protein n=1 Tax=Neorhizobium galegae TaxID=399 RepID=UPI001AEA6BA1|nr:nitroreductase family protein [Neorhizobium galegae]MBP2550522.1 nitroreductase [Neorhizobium galegae]